MMNETATFEVGNLLSPLSAHGVEKRLAAIPGVVSASVNPVPASATVSFDRAKVTRVRVGPKEYKTTWSYVMALDDADTYNKFTHTHWPADPATTPGFTSP